MTRRDLGRLTAAAAALAARHKGKAQTVAAKYTSALNGIESVKANAPTAPVEDQTAE